MSLESAKAYVERITTDEEFRNKITACKDAKERMELAKAEGFDFTSEEIKQVSTEISKEDLENIAGGVCSRPGIGIDVFQTCSHPNKSGFDSNMQAKTPPPRGTRPDLQWLYEQK